MLSEIQPKFGLKNQEERENIIHDLALLIKAIVRTLGYKRCFKSLLKGKIENDKRGESIQLARDYCSYAYYLLMKLQKLGGLPFEDEFQKANQGLYGDDSDQFNEDVQENLNFFNQLKDRHAEFIWSLPDTYAVNYNTLVKTRKINEGFQLQYLSSPTVHLAQVKNCIKVINIDPTQLDSESHIEGHTHGQLLKKLLEKNKEIKYFPKGKQGPLGAPYCIEIEGMTYFINLTKNLLWRARKDNREGDRWEVFSDDLFAHSAAVKIHKSEGVLKQEKDTLIFKSKPDQRLIKLEFIQGDEQEINEAKARIAKEGEMSREIPYLHFKPQTFQQMKSGAEEEGFYKHCAFSTMDLIKGQTLRKLLDSDDFKSWDDNKKLKLTCNLLTALRGLHHRSNPIFHRDIKPENIIIADDLSVKFIDFGDATHQNEKSQAGTQGYKSYEAISQKSELDEKSDVFSLGRVIGEIWGANCPRNTDMAKATIDDLKNYKHANLFNGLQTKPYHKYIQFALEWMDKEEKSERPFANQALFLFNAISEEPLKGTKSKDSERYLAFIDGYLKREKQIMPYWQLNASARHYAENVNDTNSTESIKFDIYDKFYHNKIKLLELLNNALQRSQTTKACSGNKKIPKGATFFDRLRINDKEISKQKEEALSRLIRHLTYRINDEEFLTDFLKKLLEQSFTPGGADMFRASATEIIRKQRGFLKSTLLKDLEQFKKDQIQPTTFTCCYGILS